MSENVALGGLIFEKITDYGFMHSSPFINSALIDAIALGEDFANEYLKSRLKDVDHAFKIKTQFEIRSDKLRICADGEYGAIETSVWVPESVIQSKLFKSEGTLQPMDLRFLDVQHIHKNTKIGRDFTHALQECQNIKFFMNPIV